MTKKAKLLLGLNILLLVAITIALQSPFSNSSTSSSSAQFAVADTSLVQQIQLGPKKLVKEKPNAWVLNDTYLASNRKIKLLIDVLAKLDIKRPLSGQEAEKISNLIKAKGQTITIKDQQGQTIQSFRIYGEGEETYASLDGGEPYNIYIPGTYLNLYEWLAAPVTEWRNKQILQTSWRTLKGLSVSYIGDTENSFEIGFNEKFYEVKGVQKLDTAALYNYIVQYQDFRITQFLTQETELKEQLKEKTPFCTIAIQDLYEQRNDTLDIYPVGKDPVGYLRRSNELVALNPKSLESVLVPRKAFQKK